MRDLQNFQNLHFDASRARASRLRKRFILTLYSRSGRTLFSRVDAGNLLTCLFFACSTQLFRPASISSSRHSHTESNPKKERYFQPDAEADLLAKRLVIQTCFREAKSKQRHTYRQHKVQSQAHDDQNSVFEITSNAKRTHHTSPFFYKLRRMFCVVGTYRFDFFQATILPRAHPSGLDLPSEWLPSKVTHLFFWCKFLFLGLCGTSRAVPGHHRGLQENQ